MTKPTSSTDINNQRKSLAKLIKYGPFALFAIPMLLWIEIGYWSVKLIDKLFLKNK